MQVTLNVNSAPRAVSNSATGAQKSSALKHCTFSFQIRTLKKEKPMPPTYRWPLLVHIPS